MSDLCATVRTFEDAIATFGAPDREQPAGLVIWNKREDGCDTCFPRRTISYDRLSETAIVTFQEREDGRASVSFQGKYIGHR